MARRAARQEEMELVLDSFVDIVANTLGILIIFVIIIMQTTGEKLSKLTKAALLLNLSKDDYAKIDKQYEELRKKLNPQQIKDMADIDNIQEDIAKIKKENAPKNKRQQEIRMNMEKKNKDIVALEDNVKKASVECERLISEQIDFTKSKGDRELKVQQLREKISPEIAKQLDSGKKSVDAINAAKAELAALIEETDGNNKLLASLTQKRDEVIKNDPSKLLEQSKKDLADQITIFNKADSDLIESQKKLDDLTERSEHVALAKPKEEARAKKFQRLVFECADTGVLFLYETDGRRITVNADGYDWPKDKTSPPITVSRKASGENAVALWKSNGKNAAQSDFEKRLNAADPAKCDVVFIVREDGESYRNFRRARFIAEGIKGGYAVQWELVPKGNTLTLRQPGREAETKPSAPSGEKTGTSTDLGPALPDPRMPYRETTVAAVELDPSQHPE